MTGRALPAPGTVAQSFAQPIAAALLDPTSPTPAGLRAWNGSDPGVRFAVYRNNVVHSLVGVLADSFPVVQALVGSDFFGAMARIYLRTQPPTSPLMHHYGAGLPSWMASFGPATALPYLCDVARLEWARLCAFHAADAPPVTAQALTARLQAPEALARTPLRLHPSVAVVCSAHPVVSLWQAHQRDDAGRDQQLAALDLGQPEAALVFRDAADDAIVLPLRPADAELAAAIAGGQSLGAAQGSHPQADLVQVLTPLLQHGLVTGVGPLAPETDTDPPTETPP